MRRGLGSSWVGNAPALEGVGADASSSFPAGDSATPSEMFETEGVGAEVRSSGEELFRNKHGTQNADSMNLLGAFSTE